MLKEKLNSLSGVFVEDFFKAEKFEYVGEKKKYAIEHEVVIKDNVEWINISVLQANYMGRESDTLDTALIGLNDNLFWLVSYLFSTPDESISPKLIPIKALFKAKK